MSDQLKLESPTLRRLQRDLRRRQRKALKPFWTTVRIVGAPIVEPLKTDRRQSLLTFLWKGRPGTEHVALRSMAFGLEGAATELSRIPKTDVWFRTCTVPCDFRTVYQFAVNDSPAPIRDWPDWMARERTWLVDPLNRVRFTWIPDKQFPKDPMGNRQTSYSYVELAKAPRHREVEPRRGVGRGKCRMYRIRSRILGDSRRVWLYEPPGFRPGLKPPRVAFFFDGFCCTTPIYPVPTVLDNLLHEELVPPIVGVFIDARGWCSDRWKDMIDCPEPFGRFLVHELLPWVERKLGIHCRPNSTALAGFSGGGLSALRYALAYPQHFRLVLSHSGSFWAEDPVRHEPGAVIGAILRWPRPLPLRVYMEAGIYENRAGDSGVTLLDANRHVRDVLRLKGYQLTYREFTGGHDVTCWRQSLVDALMVLFGRSTR